MARAGQRPLVRLAPAVPRATSLDGCPRSLCVQRQLERNVVRGIRVIGVFLAGLGVDAVGLTVRLATVADDVLGRQLAGENMALARPRRPAGHREQERQAGCKRDEGGDDQAARRPLPVLSVQVNTPLPASSFALAGPI